MYRLHAFFFMFQRYLYHAKEPRCAQYIEQKTKPIKWCDCIQSNTGGISFNLISVHHT